MRTVIVGPRPPEIDALIARRHALGQDTHDEVWEGEYHMNAAPHARHAIVAWRVGSTLDAHLPPAFTVATELNIGSPANFRVPDLAIIREADAALYMPTAALVVEVVSPGDESRQKFGHYAEHGVGEVLIVDPDSRTVELFVLADDARYAAAQRSLLTGIHAADLPTAIRWPA
jgi:hypothetical protein